MRFTLTENSTIAVPTANTRRITGRHALRQQQPGKNK